MPFFIRFFDFENGTEMFFDESSYSNWLKPNKAPAAAIAGVSGKTLAKSELSVYETDGTNESIERIVVAMEAKDGTLIARSSKKRLYALLPKDKIVAAGIEIDDTIPGETADDTVNSWHRNLIHLDMKKISKILDLVYHKGVTWGICQPEHYCKLVKTYSDQNKLNAGKINLMYKKALGL